MPFSYTAANSEGKKLTGVINAASPDDAKQQLNLLGLSILEIKTIETSPTPPPSGDTASADIQKLQFEATDKNGKQIKGTIPAKNPLLAYKRLVEEYHFTVNNLGPLPAGTHLEEIKNQYEVERHEAKNEKTGTGKPLGALSEDPAFLMEKELLLKQIEEILKKVRAMLAQYETKISPEKRAEIEGTIDKLMRIRSSNNLDYIRHTCTELLKKVQEDEVFLTSVQHEQERSEVVMESQRMMMELQKAAAAKADVGVQIQHALEKIEAKLKNSKWEFLLHPLEKLKKSIPKSPEAERLKTQKKVLSREQWDALKIALKTPKEMRKAAWQNLKNIRNEQKTVTEKLKALRHLQAQRGLLIREERRLRHLEEAVTFTGWLLFFYLLYYYLGYYVTTEQLPLKPFLGIPFDLSDSALFKYLLAVIFVVHAATSLKLNFFLRNKTATLVLVPVTVFTALLVVFNA